MKRKHNILINYDLLRRIAWSFNHTTGLPFEELLSEATIAWFKAEETYNPDMGTKFTTHAYNVMQNHLINFIKTENEFCSLPENYEGMQSTQISNFWEVIFGLSDKAKQVVEFITSDPHKFLGLAPKYARSQISWELYSEGWKWGEIRSVMSEIKEVFN